MWFVVSGQIATEDNLVFYSMRLKAITSQSFMHQRPCSSAAWQSGTTVSQLPIAEAAVNLLTEVCS